MSLSIICLEKSTNYITVCPEFTRGSGLSPLLEGGAHVVSGPPNQQRREIPLYPVSLLSTVEKCSTSYTVKMRAVGHLLWSFLPLSHCTSGCAGGTCLEWRTDPPIWGICNHGIGGIGKLPQELRSHLHILFCPLNFENEWNVPVKRDQRGNLGLPLCWFLFEELRTCMMSKRPSFFFFSFFFFLLCWVFVVFQELSLVAEVGVTLCWGVQASQCGGLSCCWARALGTWASVAARGLSSWVHGLSCSAACGIFPDQGSNLCPLH